MTNSTLSSTQKPKGGVKRIEDVPSDALMDLKFVVTGVFENITRADIEDFISSHGGKKMSGVSGKTNYLIAGYKLEDDRDITEGSKYRKAQQCKVAILTET